MVAFLMLRRIPDFFGLRGIRTRDIPEPVGLFVAVYVVVGIATRFLPPQTSKPDLPSVAASSGLATGALVP